MNPTLTLEEIYTPVDADLKRVPQMILDILATPNELAGDVINYFFSGRGKLLRPALTLLGAQIKGATPSSEELLRLAASFEIFHAATLIHDDIIDSAYLRRNLPTVNAKWNSQVAVLVGDYLHDKAMGTIFQAASADIFSLFLETAGVVCDGEIHELNEKGNFHLTEDEYIQIVDKKTAVLLSCCVEAGGRFSGVPDEEAAALSRFGRLFGIAFQIADDCLDFTGNEHEFGKTLGADIAAGVLTLPLIRVLEVSSASKRQQIIEVFKSADKREKFQELLHLIRENGAIDYSLEQARGYSQKAQAELEIFPDSQARQSLQKLLDYVLERNK